MPANTISTAPCLGINAIKAQLKRRFPGWRFIETDRGNWWALRGPLPRGQMHLVDTVDASAPGRVHGSGVRKGHPVIRCAS